MSEGAKARLYVLLGLVAMFIVYIIALFTTPVGKIHLVNSVMIMTVPVYLLAAVSVFGESSGIEELFRRRS